MRHTTKIILAGTAFSSWVTQARELDHPEYNPLAQAESIQQEKDPETLITTVRIRSGADGHLKLEDVLRALARAKGYDDEALKETLPSVHLDISKERYHFFFIT